MMMYHPIKLGCKMISSSADIVETVASDLMSPHCDPELEDNKPIFLHDILANDDASPYQFPLEEILMGQCSCKKKKKSSNKLTPLRMEM